MPNWAKGTLKLRGRRENITSALKDMLLNANVSFEGGCDDDLLVFNSTAHYFYI